MNNIALLGFLIVIATGCAPEVRTTVFQQSTPKAENAQIKIYRLKYPDCDFEELGIVNSRQRNELIPMEEVMEALLAEARRFGGDAIVELSESNPIDNVSQCGIDRDPILSGTVIKFSDPSCTK